MEIHELSARNSLADTDVFAVDTGSVTNKTTLAALRTGIGLDFKIYNSVTDIGLTAGSATILTAFNALGNNAVLYTTGNDFAASALPTGAQTGTVEIVRHTGGRAHVMFYGKGNDVGDWRMPLGASSYNGSQNNLPTGTWFPDPTTCSGGSGETGTTLQITVPNNSSHLLVLAGNGGEKYWFGLLIVMSNGTVNAIEIKKGSNITAATATNKITLTSSVSNTEMAFACYPIRGGRFSAYTIS